MYEAYLLIASAWLSLITGMFAVIATQESWLLVLCVFCGLAFAWGSEQAHKRALITEREK